MIKNVVHVTCAGTMASWYFVTNEPNVVASAFRRACTFSFGTICFGSLIVAVLRYASVCRSLSFAQLIAQSEAIDTS